MRRFTSSFLVFVLVMFLSPTVYAVQVDDAVIDEYVAAAIALKVAGVDYDTIDDYYAGIEDYLANMSDKQRRALQIMVGDIQSGGGSFRGGGAERQFLNRRYMRVPQMSGITDADAYLNTNYGEIYFTNVPFSPPSGFDKFVYPNYFDDYTGSNVNSILTDARPLNNYVHYKVLYPFAQKPKLLIYVGKFEFLIDAVLPGTYFDNWCETFSVGNLYTKEGEKYFYIDVLASRRYAQDRTGTAEFFFGNTEHLKINIGGNWVPVIRLTAQQYAYMGFSNYASRYSGNTDFFIEMFLHGHPAGSSPSDKPFSYTANEYYNNYSKRYQTTNNYYMVELPLEQMGDPNKDRVGLDDLLGWLLDALPSLMIKPEDFIPPITLPSIPDFGLPDIPSVPGLPDLPGLDIELPTNQVVEPFVPPNILLTKFPFSIPWDLYAAFKMMSAPPVAPKWDIPFKIDSLNIDYTVTIDLSFLDQIIPVCKWFLLILFAIYLALATRRIIRI